MAHTVIGTAGHIDHGKTLLVKGLTGEDTDRTPQEKARGITIELGFAFLGDDATIIDVPGHERFVKTMVAGVSSIDLALFVIAADDGVMPQSREHLDVLELLGVPRGIVVLNKVDLVEEEWLEMVEGGHRCPGRGDISRRCCHSPGVGALGSGAERARGGYSRDDRRNQGEARRRSLPHARGSSFPDERVRPRLHRHRSVRQSARG